MENNNKDNNNVLEIIKKYYDLPDLKIILEMIKEPFDEKKESLLTYLRRKLKNMDISVNEMNKKLIFIDTGYECHEYLFLSPLEKFFNKNFSNIFCYTDIINSSAYLLIELK